MKLAIFLALFSLAAAASVSHEDVIAREWEQFKAQHGKSYATKEEESFRKNVFLENREKIAQHNLRAANGEESFTLGMNEYGDLLHDEFNRMMNGYKNASRRATRPTATFMAPLNTEVPKSVDWRDKGYVTPIKNQGNCGSCWAFSATGSLEGQTFRKTGKLVSLSEQNLVDCSTKYDNSGCKGGLMDSAFRYIKENNGIDTEESYPYEGRDGKCRFSKSKIGATDKGFVDIKEGDEEELTKAIATVGPVSVAIDASSLFFQFYRSGVYYGSSCSSTDLNHGVLAVGYGTDSKGRDYYIVKNSWGKSWGNSGYVLMSRNKKNNCGIATEASYPLV